MNGGAKSGGGRPLALVTGGCRRLGAAIALRLAEAGYDLALHSGPDSGPEADLLAAIARAGGESGHLVADLAEAEAAAGLVPEARARFGRPVALLVNNAARFLYDSPESADAGGMLGHYAVNTVAPLLLAQAIAGQGGAAAIVNILDQRIAAPHGDQLSYTLSKLALAELTLILARQFAPRVRVCGVAPGLTLPSEDFGEGGMERAAAHMPLERLAQPGEIADAVAWLARAEAVTGQILYVDAGAHLRRYERDFPFL